MYQDRDINFTVENGSLKPDAPLDLPEGTRGIAHIRSTNGAVGHGGISREHALEVIRQIGESGVFNSGGAKLTREQMHERR